MNNIIIYGPRGCGKTLNGERFRKHYCMQRVVEGEAFERAMATGQTMALSGNLILIHEKDIEKWAVFGTCISFATAMKAAEGTA
jgi:cytidylate kinase